MKTLYLFAALSSFSLLASDLSSYDLLLEQDKFRQLQQQLEPGHSTTYPDMLGPAVKNYAGVASS